MSEQHKDKDMFVSLPANRRCLEYRTQKLNFKKANNSIKIDYGYEQSTHKRKKMQKSNAPFKRDAQCH